jgi:hypothetical protein
LLHFLKKSSSRSPKTEEAINEEKVINPTTNYSNMHTFAKAQFTAAATNAAAAMSTSARKVRYAFMPLLS